jgi:HK97 family phage major capsid protein
MADGAAAAVESALRRDRAGLGARYLAAVADENYRSAFGLMLAHPMDAQLRMTPEQAAAVRTVHEATEARALAEGVGSTGGFGVPFALDPTILLSSNGVLNPIRDVASSITIATSEWKGVSSEGVTAHFAVEAEEVSDDSPALAQPVIHVERAQAFVPFSIEMQGDYAGLESELGNLLRDAKDVLEATKFLSGAGHASHEPEGLLTGLTNTQRVLTAVAKTFAIADVYALKQALPPRFLIDCEFAAAPNVYDQIFRFVGGGSTEPKLMPTRDGGLLGRPAIEWSTMNTATATTGAKPLLAGDMDEFRIVDRLGMNIELIPHLFGANRRPTGQRGLYAIWRTGSAVLVPNAFRFLEVA